MRIEVTSSGKYIGMCTQLQYSIEELVKGDVEKYVRAALEDRDLASWGREEKDKIKKKLLSFKERRFRWADLQMKRFAKCAKTEDLQAALDSVPPDLESAYQRAFEGIETGHQKDVRKIMRWLAVSLEPLSSRQIAAVVGYRAPEFVNRVCTSLLVTSIIKNTDDIITLAHFSVKEFLIVRLHEEASSRWYQFSSELAHREIALTALEALLEPEGQWRLILHYAAKHWPQHAKEGLKKDKDEMLEGKIDEILSQDHQAHFRGWLEISDLDADEWIVTSRRTKTALLLDRRGDQVTVTDKVVEAAAGNEI
ncbi:hypothetical protein F5883DRAFT_619843 [Diaporthe sp. PMI_573]|nr:hypothetical protein F5883DRAFT_619843 [Diaporthaceae sp. PMI_573]